MKDGEWRIENGGWKAEAGKKKKLKS